jgi:hypothetical protein
MKTIEEIEKRIKEIETKKGYVSNEELKELMNLRCELSFILNWNFKKQTT